MSPAAALDSLTAMGRTALTVEEGVALLAVRRVGVRGRTALGRA